jgi:hypothetical protein
MRGAQVNRVAGQSQQHSSIDLELELLKTLRSSVGPTGAITGKAPVDP